MTAATQGTATSVTHGSFTVERTYPCAPARVFAAWASRDAKNAWFGEGDDYGSHDPLRARLPDRRPRSP